MKRKSPLIIKKMAEETKEVTIKVFLFSKAEEWSNWKALFLAQVNCRDLEMSKVFDYETPFVIEEKITVDGKDVVKTNEKNKKTMRKAYEELLMSMDGRKEGSDGFKAFEVVKWNYPDAREAFRILNDRYEPKTTLEKGKLMNEFYTKECKAFDDPEHWVLKLEDIRFKIQNIDQGKERIDDDEFMRSVLDCLPSSYEALADRLRVDLDCSGMDKLTIP